MKSLSELLHRSPWWALLVTGFATLFALAAFVTPYHIIDYRDDGGSPEQRRAIKREVDSAFAENAIDAARGVIRGMRASTKDPERRAEFEEALRSLDEARQEIRDAGTEALRAKRDALDQSREAARTAHKALENARREVENALRHSGTSPEAAKALDDALKAAQEAEKKIEQDSAATKPRKRVRIGVSGDSNKPLVDIEVGPAEPGAKPGVTIQAQTDPPPAPAVPAHPAPPSPPALADMPAPPSPPSVDPLPAEVRDRIRQNVTGDMYRIGIGAALMLILLPMFVLALIAKFFIDRSRAATRMADLKRKEAEHHRMGQQLTEAKLQALQAQVEPHFLYNTLASVQALTEVDPAKANEMTGHLIQYLRNALPKMREGVSTVGQEVELVRAYLSILQMRMGKRLAFEIAVPENVNAIAFPPLMLPSLVENAIKHGLEPQREGGTVRIGAELVDGRLRMTVADTGRGFGETIGAGVGLANIRERLAALYGDSARLTLVENEPRGVLATIEVPAERGGNSAGAAPAAAPEATAATGDAPSDSARDAAAAAPAFTKSSAVPLEPSASAETLTGTRKVVLALGAVERFWRKALIYLFYALVIVAGVAALVGIVGVLTGTLPMMAGDESFEGPGGALLGIAAMLLAFVVGTIAIAIVVAVIYALGFLMLAVVLFVAAVMVIAISPLLAPVVLFGLLVWWLLRKKSAAAAREVKVEPVMAPDRPL